MEIPTIGNPYTWRKRKIDIDNIYEKLDRVLVSDKLLQWYPNLFTNNHAFSTLDHCPILVELDNNEPHIGRPFKFEKV